MYTSSFTALSRAEPVLRGHLENFYRQCLRGTLKGNHSGFKFIF